MGRLYTCLLRFKFMTKTADYTGRKEEPSFSGTAMPSRWEIWETEVRGKIVEVVGKAPFTVLERDYSLGRAGQTDGEEGFPLVLRGVALKCDLKIEGICQYAHKNHTTVLSSQTSLLNKLTTRAQSPM